MAVCRIIASGRCTFKRFTVHFDIRPRPTTYAERTALRGALHHGARHVISIHCVISYSEAEWPSVAKSLQKGAHFGASRRICPGVRITERQHKFNA